MNRNNKNDDSLMLLVRTVLKALLLHASALNQFDGALPLTTLRYVEARKLAELDTALYSSDDSQVRQSWRFFATAAEDVRLHCLEIVSVVLPTLPDKFILHEDIPLFVDELQFA